MNASPYAPYVYILNNGLKKVEKYCNKYLKYDHQRQKWTFLWNGRILHFILWDKQCCGFPKLHFFSGFCPLRMVETVITHLCICTVVLLFSWGVYLQNSAAITLIINIRLNEQFHRSLLKLVQVLYVLFLIWKNVCHSVEWLWKKGKGTYIHICAIFVNIRYDHIVQFSILILQMVIVFFYTI